MRHQEKSRQDKRAHHRNLLPLTGDHVAGTTRPTMKNEVFGFSFRQMFWTPLTSDTRGSGAAKRASRSTVRVTSALSVSDTLVDFAPDEGLHYFALATCNRIETIIHLKKHVHHSRVPARIVLICGDTMERGKSLQPIVKAVAILILTALVIRPAEAEAARLQKTTRVIAIAQSTLDSTAHWILPIESVNGACNGAIYIPYDDKEMFAVALTADTNKYEVDLYYESSATSVTIQYGTSPTSFSTTCRLIAIGIKYVA
jgi:hypothetical protein